MRSQVCANIARASFSSMILAGWIVFTSVLYPQAQEAPKYSREEYQEYQDATNEADPAKKTQLICKFLKDRPESTLRQHVTAAYQILINDLLAKENWKQLVSSGEAFMAVVPDDIYSVSMLATGYQKTNNLSKFVEYGEKMFEKSPAGNAAYYLAKAYKDLKNDSKYLFWAEKTIELLPNNYELLVDVTEKFAQSKKGSQAAKYGRLAIKALQTTAKPDTATDKDWKAYVDSSLAKCYAVVGNVAYDAQDYNTAVTNLENSLRYFNKNGVAYYYLAQSHWQQGKIDLAMKNFAKSYLLKGGTAAASKQHLENLYKSTHQNSLVGLERVMEKAQAELK